MWEASVPVWQQLALQEGSAVGLDDKGIIHHFLAGKSFSCLQCILTHCGRVVQICVFNTVKLGTSASSPKSTPQGGMFPEVSHPQALLGSLVSIS